MRAAEPRETAENADAAHRAVASPQASMRSPSLIVAEDFEHGVAVTGHVRYVVDGRRRTHYIIQGRWRSEQRLSALRARARMRVSVCRRAARCRW